MAAAWGSRSRAACCAPPGASSAWRPKAIRRAASGRATELVVELAASATDPAPVEAVPVPVPAVRSRRVARAAAIAAALLAVVLAGWAGFRPSGSAGEPAPAVVAAEERPDDVVLDRAEGAIERLRPGGWEAVAAGQRLLEDDTIRTGAGASATLAIGDRSRVTVSDATQLTVREITVAAQRLRLSRGRISVDHQPGGARVIVVESEDGGSVARAGTARFSALASGKSLAVATETGVVRLQAGGGSVDVGAGRQAVSFRGEAPDPTTPIPPALLLKIARTARGEGVCTVAGVAERGAEVRVEGRLVEVGGDGRFSIRLAARRVAMHATVITRDAAGHVAERRVPCEPIRPGGGRLGLRSALGSGCQAAPSSLAAPPPRSWRRPRQRRKPACRSGRSRSGSCWARMREPRSSSRGSATRRPRSA